MDMWIMWTLFIGVIVLLIAGASFGLAYWMKVRKVQKAKRLYVEIYFKKGGRESLTASVDDDHVKLKRGGVMKRYYIIKEAIQEEVQNHLLKGPKIFKFIQFDEELAMPFILGLVGDKVMKQYIGADRIEQFMKTKIWEDVGGLGGGMGSPMAYAGIAVLVIGAIIIAVVFLRK